MRVGSYATWLRHIEQADKQPLLVRRVDWQGERYNVASQTVDTTYAVRYVANDEGEYISCTCPAGRRGLACKHAAGVLALVHPQEFRKLLRRTA